MCVVIGDDKWELGYVGVVVGDDKWELQGGGGYVCVCVCVVVGDDKWELQGGGVYVGVCVAGCVGVCVCVCVCVWWLGMISGSYKEGEGMWVCGCGG